MRDVILPFNTGRLQRLIELSNETHMASRTLAESSRFLNPKMYCFCTARLPIRAIPAISEDVIGAERNQRGSCFSKYLWQNDGGFAQGAG
jgi:hypothetical protein